MYGYCMQEVDNFEGELSYQTASDRITHRKLQKIRSEAVNIEIFELGAITKKLDDYVLEKENKEMI